jgi:CubicO group peptidase (beta-lactamase class C family)
LADPQSVAQDILDDLVARDVERGLQVAAFFQGELVVDGWSGIADPGTGREVDGDTLFTVWSCTKGVAATALHLLAERGMLEYDRPIATYWPEFAAHGKGAITPRHVLTHTSSIPQFPDGIGPEELLDWETMCRAIADLCPLWTAGTMGYHANTYGWLVGEIARRVDGRSIDRIIQEEICAPLGIDGIFLGIPDAVEPRVARLEEDAEQGPPPAIHVVPPWRRSAADWANHPAVRRACLPSSGGIMNARSLARHYAALAGALPDEQRLLPPTSVRRVSALHVEAEDRILGSVERRALGYHLGQPGSAMGSRVTVFGHAGAGGSIGFADPDHAFAFALTKNRMTHGAPEESAAYLVARAIRAALDIPEEASGEQGSARRR